MMSSPTPPTFPPIEIGQETRSPVVVRPEPRTVFARRARRFNLDLIGT